MEFLSGNQAIVKGAIQIGAKLYSGYPITPASEIMERWGVRAQEDEELNFIQSEDELAAIHHALGGAVNGVPSFTATSGPGLSLMQEGLGLAFAYQAPLVVVDVMRSGPSTGAPTRVGQGEIIASRYGTHGDVSPFVFYPTSVKECYDYTVKAFQIAWQHRVPVIILSDAYLAHMQENVDLKEVKEQVGESEQKIKHFGGLIERHKNAEKINELETVADQKYRDFDLWGNRESDTLLIGLGSMARALRSFEGKFEIFAPLRIWPFLDQEVVKLGKNKKRVVVVEMNQGQYVNPVKQVLPEKVEFISYQEETISINKLRGLLG